MTSKTNQTLITYIRALKDHDGDYCIKEENVNDLYLALVEIKDTVTKLDLVCDSCSKAKDKEVESYKNVAQEFSDKLDKAEDFILHSLIDKSTAEQCLLDVLVYKKNVKEN